MWLRSDVPIVEGCSPAAGRRLGGPLQLNRTSGAASMIKRGSNAAIPPIAV